MTTDVIELDQNHPLPAMLDYKKRVRLLAERFNASVDYPHDDGLTVTYINEELAIERVLDLKERVLAGIAINEELGGNHYNAEFFNGILILSDVFTGAPANVVEIH